MMKCLVTGAAGFIGSHLCRRLLDLDFSVTGLDSFTDFYPKWIKEKNIEPLRKEPRFLFIDGDINRLELGHLVTDKDFIFHLAAQAGVRTSWGDNFSIYTENNIIATQRLLEAVKEKGIKKFIYASSSSVYGLSPQLPMTEEAPLFPFSPYGVTKLAGEHLCQLYHLNFGIPVVSLRFFTVYGPGQRPDMAFHRFFRAISQNKQVLLFGDGQQTRDFTFIDDIIEANLQALDKGKDGEIYNIGGGCRKKLMDVFTLLQNVTGRKIHFRSGEEQKGDVFHTYADIQKAGKELDYSPKTPLEEGLRREWEWIKNVYTQ